MAPQTWTQVEAGLSQPSQLMEEEAAAANGLTLGLQPQTCDRPPGNWLPPPASPPPRQVPEHSVSVIATVEAVDPY